MARTWRYFSIAMLFIVPLAIALSIGETANTAPQVIRLVCQVDTITTALSNNQLVIPIYVTNINDSIAGFQMWINISEPSLVKFKTDSVSAGGIYFAKIDTIGTRIKGWEFVQARILDDTIGAVLNVVGTADNGSLPAKPPVPPGSGIWFRTYLQTKGTLGDSLCDSAKVVLLINRSLTIFSDPRANIIGYSCSTYQAMELSNCAEWVGQTCVNWFDTTFAPRTDCWFDTTKALYIDGDVSFACCKCGDADGNGAFSIADAVYLINYIFAGGAAPNPLCRGDADGNSAVSIADAVFLINYIFAGGPTPAC